MPTVMDGNGNGADATSIKPVSSLRSKFENLGKDGEPKKPVTPAPRQVSLTANQSVSGERPRTSAGESGDPGFGGVVSNEAHTQVPRKRRPSPPSARPQSMLSVTPSQKSPPMVTVDSPPSSERNGSIDMRLGGSEPPWQLPSSGSGSPARAHHAKTLSRVATPVLEARMTAFQQSTEPPKINLESKPTLAPSKVEQGSVSKPPPINRSAKPSIPKKPAALAPKPATLAAPEPSAQQAETSSSPFSTPPSSGSTSPVRKRSGAPQRARNDSDASFVERLRSDSDASSAPRARGGSDSSFVQRRRGDSDAPALQRAVGDFNASYLERARAGSNASFVEPSTLPENWSPPPTHHAVAARREQHVNGLTRTGTMPARYRQTAIRDRPVTDEPAEERPRLPARPELQVRPGRTSPNKPRSGRSSSNKAQHIPAQRSFDGLKRAATMGDQLAPRRIPASKPVAQSALSQGFDRKKPPPLSAAQLAPTVPAPRRSMDKRREMPPQQQPTNGHAGEDEHESLPVEPPDTHPTASSDFPDATQTNRRPPRYKQRPYQIPTDYDTRLLAVCGETVVTSGHITKAWNLRTGEPMLNMAHHESVKVTSLIFKPSLTPEDEGKRLWLGTNIGEIHEVDIPSQRIVKTKAGAHIRREVIRMFKYAAELWTLDDNGDLNVWKPDHKGMPSLDSQYHNFRVPRGHTFSIACGKHLWIATGKEIRVYMPSARSDTEFNVLSSPLNQPGTGDVTSGATLITKPELAFFGHSDGKVSVYNRRDYSCTRVVNVSLYKISSLVGVGEYLWAGYNTGMSYVYDTSTTPWTVRKDWQAHEKQVCGVVADPSALWKMDRLQVVTLGTDNLIRIWDGFLEEEWLESQMHEHDSEYCNFREISAVVLTWNAGATKPSYLQHSLDDENFFREYMTTGLPPDIFVFGFQELVDLEDKKVTARSLFKSKKKDGGEQEHMSHQYRAWRDHLTRCIEDYMPTDAPYTLLHTASLVGLFTCIFVKSSERPRIKHVQTAEVKRGMGGLHGNKGALVLRMVLDDSSICFVNCHLAAGQTQTIHRNNDIAAILESEALPAYPLSNSNTTQHGDVFAAGGDGSMILDHEICILNGDLNYRIDTMGRDTVIKNIQQNNLARLLERDQLLLSRKKNPGFRLRAFQEKPITFAPTYKYNLHSDDYDTSEKRRAPAWCDRILYRGLGKVKMEEYRRWEVRVSDHRPVSGRLRLRVKSVMQDRRQIVWQQCQQDFDAYRARVGKAVQ